MEWKEFFRPNKYKINIALIILFIGIALGMIQGYITNISCHSWSCYSLEYKVISILLTMIALPSLILKILLPNLEINFFIWLIAMIILLAYIYLIACIIASLIFKDKKST